MWIANVSDTQLADSSPLPVLIYNFPGVVAGLDVNSDMLDRLGRHRNIVGVKLTCGGIAKVCRVRAAFEPAEFCALAGQSDWLVPGMAVGATGVITGVANLYPKVSKTYVAILCLLGGLIRPLTYGVFPCTTGLYADIRSLHSREGEGGRTGTD